MSCHQNGLLCVGGNGVYVADAVVVHTQLVAEGRHLYRHWRERLVGGVANKFRVVENQRYAARLFVVDCGAGDAVDVGISAGVDYGCRRRLVELCHVKHHVVQLRAFSHEAFEASVAKLRLEQVDIVAAKLVD